MQARRGELDIIKNILETTYENKRKYAIMVDSNLTTSRINEYLDKLIGMRLIEKVKVQAEDYMDYRGSNKMKKNYFVYRITKDGKDFLEILKR